MRVTIQRARNILADLELDSRLMNDRSAYVAMVCCGLNNSSQWDEAHKTSLGINDMILAINSGFPKANKGHGYKPNTRETIRDKTVKPFIANGLLSIEDPAISANSSKVRYTSSDHLVNLFQSALYELRPSSQSLQIRIQEFIQDRVAAIEEGCREKTKRLPEPKGT